MVDLPTAIYETSADLTDGRIIGQLAGTTAGGDQFGLVLDKGSSLTAKVSAAVDALKADGALAKLETKWLADYAKAPVLN